MTTVMFTARVSRIKNRKNKDYYIYRINIPAKAAQKLRIDKNDDLVIWAKKARWYDLIDWSSSPKSMEKLPKSIKYKIKKEQDFAPESEEELEKIPVESGSPHPFAPSPEALDRKIKKQRE